MFYLIKQTNVAILMIVLNVFFNYNLKIKKQQVLS